MNIDDFLDPLERALNARKIKCNDKKEFVEYLSTRLCLFIFEKYPSLKENIVDKIKVEKEAEIASQMAFDSYCDAFDGDDIVLPGNIEKLEPIVQSRSESKRLLEEHLNELPEKYHKGLAKIHWQEYEYEVGIQQIKKDTHHLMKKAIVHFFEEELKKFSSKKLLYLNNSLFYDSVEPFLEEVLELVE